MISFSLEITSSPPGRPSHTAERNAAGRGDWTGFVLLGINALRAPYENGGLNCLFSRKKKIEIK